MSQDELIRTAAINVVKKSAEFLRLEPDWDSYGGKPVNLITVQAAIAFLARVVDRFGGSLGAKAIPLHVAPLSDGGIQYEWMQGDNGIEIETHPDIVRFGLGTFMENQALMIEVIAREAAKQLDRKQIKSLVIADEVRFIFQELGLCLKLQ